MRIKSAQKLRSRIKVPDAVSDAKAKTPEADAKPKRARKKLSAAQRQALTTKPAGKAKHDKQLSLIGAAVQVLAGAGEPMNCKQIVEQVSAKKLWSPRRGGKTPHATLYSAILREIQSRGKDARFKKTERGVFAVVAAAKKEG